MLELARLLAWMLLEANPIDVDPNGLKTFEIGLGDRVARVEATFGEWEDGVPTWVTVVSARIGCEVVGCDACGVTTFTGGPWTVWMVGGEG